MLKKELYKKFLSLYTIKFLRYLKKVDPSSYYKLVWLNAAQDSDDLITNKSIYDLLFIRTFCRKCNRKTKFKKEWKRYHSFCSLTCKAAWYKENNQSTYLTKEENLIIKDGIQYKRKHKKRHQHLKSLYYENYKLCKRTASKLGIKFIDKNLYHFLFGRRIKFCKFCSNITKWDKNAREYFTYCSSQCTNSDLRHRKRHGNTTSKI